MIDDCGNEAVQVIESDKADMDVEAFEDGYLAKILMQEGETTEVGLWWHSSWHWRGTLHPSPRGAVGAMMPLGPPRWFWQRLVPCLGGVFVFSLDMQIMFKVMEVSTVLDWTRDEEPCVIASFH
ncbi:hypothetical protein ACHAXA_000496 [Cyclostephanos tholiformis]|uniref:Lipoyl-binding domain-containing protein n=1 Tax=Cyclostephanos tholiformis TaxID=382380 RepID=A0ABD3STS0_9STRA